MRRPDTGSGGTPRQPPGPRSVCWGRSVNPASREGTPVKIVGSPSWQFGEVEGKRAHVLLYIRDVAALEVPAEVDAPPRLAGMPPHGSRVVDDDDRRRAGREW